MIFGIGTDVVQLARVEEIFARHGEHFVRRLLMPQEEAAFRAYRRPVRFLAMRFAAKEAIVKALGTGFAHGVWIRDVGVAPNAWGRPRDHLVGARPRACATSSARATGTSRSRDEAGLVVAVAVLMRKESK